MTTMFDNKQKVENPESLMEQYKSTRNVQLRNDLVMHYSYIAQTMAVQMRGIAANYAQVEDIVNQGMISLIDCVERFEPDKGVKFESYAYMRVKGSIIDFVRKQDWIPRRVRRTAKEVTAAHDFLTGVLLREPTPTEMAEHLGITDNALQKHYSEIMQSVTLSFEGILQNSLTGTSSSMEDIYDQEAVPESSIMKQELKKVLMSAIDELTEKERIVVTLYYYEELKLKEISQILEVSESRVCQIHSKVIIKLRQKLENYMKG